MKSGIYKIFNRITEKLYIGSAVNIQLRWIRHRSDLRYNRHQNPYLQASWNLHGEVAFEFSIIELCSKENIVEREQFWMLWTRCTNPATGYNINPTARSPKGVKRSAETRKRMSDAKLNLTPEKRALMIARQSEARKGKQLSAEHKANIGKSGLGRIVSEETRAKISDGNKGKFIPEDQRLKMSLAKKGKTFGKRGKYRPRIKKSDLSNNTTV